MDTDNCRRYSKGDKWSVLPYRPCPVVIKVKCGQILLF